jgi:RNA polymerase sigma-70 factor (ECF subfamily)
MNDSLTQFRSIHDTYRSRIQRYLARLVGEPEAEDLTQLVLYKISEGLSRFRHESELSTWIYRIATNTALDALRRSGRRPAPGAQAGDAAPDEDAEAQEDLPLGPQRQSLEASIIRGEMSSCIREFVSRLPENYRAVMVLSELEGFKNNEIGAILGISVETVKIRLHRARERLRRELSTGCSFHRDQDAGFSCDRKP